ncbi:MAG: ABC transporter substrate-binding protein, partial [Desertimonas sp.]
MTRRLRVTSVAIALAAMFAVANTARATTDTTEAEAEPATGAGNAEPGATSGSGWIVDTEACADPDAATAPIEGTVKIGMVVPLSGGPAAAAFQPVTEGMQAYIDWANENAIVPGVTLELSIVDDQYNPSLTPDAVNGLLDDGVHLFSGNIGSPNNAAVMDLLNEECVPQMMALSGLPEFGDEVADYPWTFGG